MTDPSLSRRMWRTLEPYHGFLYFSPVAAAAMGDLGVPAHAAYFATRAAALGAVPAEVVIATFYNFEPGLVRAAIPAAWEHASPSAIVAARYAAADQALRDVLGDDVAAPELVEAADLTAEAVAACRPEGRPLFAAHAAVDRPEAPHLALWHDITLLREFRGDGHIAALVLEGLDGCEALVTHGLDPDSGVAPEVLQLTRSWSDADWAAARGRLADRGLVDAAGLTPAGAAARQRVEQRTDEAALAPWVALGAERGARLRSLVRPFSRAIVGSGAFDLSR